MISDTHGLVRPQVPIALRGVDIILHAGDIGTADVLKALNEIAPVYAIKGNNDRGAWARKVPDTMVFEVADVKLYVIHAIQDLNVDPAAKGFNAVISGHSHKPVIRESNGVLYINPGSAGPRRFKLPVVVGKLRVGESELGFQLIELV